MTGEVFDYTRDPWYYLLELSGIPFGMMSDLYGWGPAPRGEPNLFYGAVVGMTARMPNGPGIVPVRATWQLWDAFDIASATLRGWWDDTCPVNVRVLPDSDGHTSLAPVKATAFVPTPLKKPLYLGTHLRAIRSLSFFCRSRCSPGTRPS